MSKIEIESAFVESWNKNTEQHPAWALKCAEPHSRKNDAGKFETVGRTFRTVKVSKASGIDLTVFRKGDRVQVWGREVTETREHEGNKYFDLVVWADRVEPVGATAGSVSGHGDTNVPYVATNTSSEVLTPQTADSGNWSTSEIPF